MQTIVDHNPFASTVVPSRGDSKRAFWTGRAISGLAVAFLVFDSAGKLLEVQPAIEGTKQLGYPPDIVFSLGMVLLSCVYVAAFLWSGLVLCDVGLRAFLPWHDRSQS
jgi:hypothetical protein